MKKFALSMLIAGAALALNGAGFDEKFADADLSPQSWMQTIAENCKGVAYKKPLNGKLVLSGVLDGKPGASAVLERDACYTTGDFHWSVEVDLDFSQGTSGGYLWHMMSDNGEVQLGVSMQKAASGEWTLKGLVGHTCKTLKASTVKVSKNPCKVEIIRNKTGYKLLCNGKVFYTADGDTATLASIRMSTSGNAVKTVKSMQLKKL